MCDHETNGMWESRGGVIYSFCKICGERYETMVNIMFGQDNS